MEGHWSRTSHMSKHLVDLYQASLKEEEKIMEVNFVYENDAFDHDPTHSDVTNFFEHHKERIDYLIGDGNVPN